MKSYLKTGRAVALTAMLATLTLFSCNKQENVEPAPNQKALDTETIVATSKAFVVGEKGKQIPLEEFKKQVAENAKKARAVVISGKLPVSRELVQAYSNSHRGYTPQLTWIKQKYSDMFIGSTTAPNVAGATHRLDGVSFGDHQFGSGPNASKEIGWTTDVNYEFEKVGGVYETRGTWQTVTGVQVQAPSHQSYTIQPGFELNRITIQESSSVTKTNTHGIDLGFSVEASFAKIYKVTASVNYSFSTSTATMNGGSVSDTYIPRLLYPITVPQGKTCDLVVQKQEVVGHQRYKAKTWFNGLVGGNHDKRIDGHYWWARSARLFFDKAHNKYQELTQNEDYPLFRFALINCR